MHYYVGRAVIAAGTMALIACESDPRPPARGIRDDSSDSGAAASEEVTRPGQPHSPNQPSGDAAIPRYDAGNAPFDAALPQITGVIDPDDVTLVTAEAAAPLVSVCARDVARDARNAALLTDDAKPLSITPDGSVWAYATVHLPDAGAPIPDAGADAGSDALHSDAPRVSVSVHVANASSEWVFTLPDDQDAERGAALDATGARLVTTRSDAKGFVLWELDAESERFVVAEDQPFVRLNALASQGGVRFERPVLSANGDRMYAHEIDEDGAITQLVLRDGQWETELRITDAASQTFSVNGLAITAVSSDDLTVFGWNAAQDHAVAWWRPRADAPFDFEKILDATPLSVSSDCEDWWTLSEN